jgi:hypothetical protein
MLLQFNSVLQETKCNAVIDCRWRDLRELIDSEFRDVNNAFYYTTAEVGRELLHR